MTVPPRPQRTSRRQRVRRIEALLARGWPPAARLTPDEARAAGALAMARRRRGVTATPVR